MAFSTSRPLIAGKGVPFMGSFKHSGLSVRVWSLGFTGIRI